MDLMHLSWFGILVLEKASGRSSYLPKSCVFPLRFGSTSLPPLLMPLLHRRFLDFRRGELPGGGPRHGRGLQEADPDLHQGPGKCLRQSMAGYAGVRGGTWMSGVGKWVIGVKGGDPFFFHIEDVANRFVDFVRYITLIIHYTVYPSYRLLTTINLIGFTEATKGFTLQKPGQPFFKGLGRSWRVMPRFFQPAVSGGGVRSPAECVARMLTPRRPAAYRPSTRRSCRWVMDWAGLW